MVESNSGSATARLIAVPGESVVALDFAWEVKGNETKASSPKESKNHENLVHNYLEKRRQSKKNLLDSRSTETETIAPVFLPCVHESHPD